MSAVEPHAPTVHHLATQVKGPLALFVGPVVAANRLEVVVAAYHVLVTYLVPDAKLAVVGPTPEPEYKQAVQLFIHELNLAGAWLAGPLPDDELLAYRCRATLLVAAVDDDPRVVAEAWATALAG